MFSFLASMATHTVHFTNNCGFGTPTLIQGGRVLSTAGDYTQNGALLGAIAYLQTGGCGFNGEGCTLVELSLNNGFSSADISLIPPSVHTPQRKFVYYNGCDGAGTDYNLLRLMVEESIRQSGGTAGDAIVGGPS
ncbi:hypothetical protein B0H19DRAFT_1199247 [Mycena capillaripes]|nr:hypothetical protein B0H19DRAFT_1199247 [Mycena capillaripes]